HISWLGCTAIYIGPLFEASSHGYDTKDYTTVEGIMEVNGLETEEIKSGDRVLIFKENMSIL
uniref:alpha-amylase family glycosyl hydrolase n=1 Tax=Duncaniella muris TaxID=2094150 RepID=UPI00272BF3F8